MRTLVPLAMVCLILGTSNTHSSDWPRWRGPDMNSVAPNSPTLLPWSTGQPAVLWQSETGIGFCSMAIANERVFTLGNNNNQDTVYCLDVNTGHTNWSYTYSSHLDPNLYEGGPSATPTIEGNVVYTLGKFGHIICFNVSDGAIVWQRHLVNDFSLSKPTWGFAGSPVIEGDMLLLNAGGHGIALNKHNGTLIWSSNTETSGYSTLIPFDLNGSRAGVMLSYQTAAAVSLDDGELLWEISWRSAFNMNCPDPIVHNGRIFVTSVSKSGRMLLPDTGATDATFPLVNLKTHLSPGVAIDDHLYAFHGDAERGTQTLTCLNLNTGAIPWTTPLPVGSLISADNKLIILTGTGELILANVSTTSFDVISRRQIFNSRCWTLPAIADDILYVRNAAGSVQALQLPVEQPPTLEINRNSTTVELSWPSAATGFALEATPQLTSPNWQPVATPPNNSGGRSTVTVNLSSGARYFRLTKP